MAPAKGIGMSVAPFLRARARRPGPDRPARRRLLRLARTANLDVELVLLPAIGRVARRLPPIDDGEARLAGDRLVDAIDVREAVDQSAQFRAVGGDVQLVDVVLDLLGDAPRQRVEDRERVDLFFERLAKSFSFLLSTGNFFIFFQ